MNDFSVYEAVRNSARDSVLSSVGMPVEDTVQYSVGRSVRYSVMVSVMVSVMASVPLPHFDTPPAPPPGGLCALVVLLQYVPRYITRRF